MNVSAVAEVAPPTSPWLYIAGLVATAIGVWITAHAPVWLEKAKGKRSPDPKPDPPPPAVVAERTDRMVDLVSEAIDDVRRERDEAQDRSALLHDKNLELAAEIAMLRAELGRRPEGGDRT